MPPKALNLGIRVVLAVIFFFIGVQIIKVIRKILKKSLTRGGADVGVIQFLDSLAKAVLYPDARRRLINMKNFEFDNESKIALPEWRVKKLENLIRNQAKLILS